MKHMDFTYKGTLFHLNDNRIGISKSNYDMFPKYRCLMYDEFMDEWRHVGNFDTKKEAIEYIKKQYLYL